MYRHLSKVLLRTPLFPLSRFNNPSNDPIFEEGIYLASSEFWKEYRKTGSINHNQKTILKYWNRSCTRCTPFGTFAGCTLVTIGENTELILDKHQFHRKHIRLDTKLLYVIIEWLLSHPAIVNQVKYYPNNTLYNTHEGFRYVEYIQKDDTREYFLNFIKKDNYVEAVLSAAKDGSTRLALADVVVSSAGVDYEEAENYVAEFIKKQIIIAEIEPNITGEEPYSRLIGNLETYSDIDDVVLALKKIKDRIDKLGDTVGYYEELESEIRTLLKGKKLPKNFFQTDLYLSSKSKEIDKKIIDTIIGQVSDLHEFNYKLENPDLAEFRSRFKKRYEEAEIPFCEALDPDFGIGYGVNASVTEALLEGIVMHNADDVTTFYDNDLNKFVINKYDEYRRSGAEQIEIYHDELKKNSQEQHAFIDNAYIIGNLLHYRGHKEGNFMFDYEGIGGPSSANLLGRFAHGDKEITEFIRHALSVEEMDRNNVIFAEVIHLPFSRAGNILLRPALRKYEIPYFGKSGIHPDFQIKVQDLKISVVHDEIILRDTKSDKRVLPRLTTAHNFHAHTLPIYRFLCDLQTQNKYNPCVWSWGALNSLKHLPRVVYKNIVLKKAQWRLEQLDLVKLSSQKFDFIDGIEAFRIKHRIPERVILKIDDSELLLDLTNPYYVNHLIEAVIKRQVVIIEEFLFIEDGCIVKDINGNGYVNELIIPIYQEIPIDRKEEGSAIIADFQKRQCNDVTRVFTPGSEWIYFKLYCGENIINEILKDVILPFIETARGENLYEKFFFLRYYDTSSHLRIRFYNSDTDKQFVLQKRFLQSLEPLMKSKVVTNVVIDSYKRELERYTPELIDQAENLFYFDSLAVLRLIHVSTTFGEDWSIFAMRCVDTFLNDFEFDLIQKHNLLGALRQSYFKEFGATLSLQRTLNERYRKYQGKVFSYINSQKDIPNRIYDFALVLKQRSKDLNPIIANIKFQLEKESLGKTLPDLLFSYIHMFMNRYFSSRQRAHELLVYHFLHKYYSSQLSMEQKKNKIHTSKDI